MICLRGTDSSAPRALRRSCQQTPASHGPAFAPATFVWTSSLICNPIVPQNTHRMCTNKPTLRASWRQFCKKNQATPGEPVFSIHSKHHACPNTFDKRSHQRTATPPAPNEALTHSSCIRNVTWSPSLDMTDRPWPHSVSLSLQRSCRRHWPR